MLLRMALAEERRVIRTAHWQDEGGRPVIVHAEPAD